MTPGVPVCASCWTLVGGGALYICCVGGALFWYDPSGVQGVTWKSATCWEGSLRDNGLSVLGVWKNIYVLISTQRRGPITEDTYSLLWLGLKLRKLCVGTIKGRKAATCLAMFCEMSWLRYEGGIRLPWTASMFESFQKFLLNYPQCHEQHMKPHWLSWSFMEKWTQCKSCPRGRVEWTGWLETQFHPISIASISLPRRFFQSLFGHSRQAGKRALNVLCHSCFSIFTKSWTVFRLGMHYWHRLWSEPALPPTRARRGRLKVSLMDQWVDGAWRLAQWMDVDGLSENWGFF